MRVFRSAVEEIQLRVHKVAVLWIDKFIIASLERAVDEDNIFYEN